MTVYTTTDDRETLVVLPNGTGVHIVAGAEEPASLWPHEVQDGLAEPSPWHPDGRVAVGQDGIGVVVESDGFRYYITDCCGASAKMSMGVVCCRSCYHEVDDRLGDVPPEGVL